MRHLASVSLVLAAALLIGCVGPSTPGVVSTGSSGEIVAIGAGKAPDMAYVDIVYFIDPQTQTCYVRFGLDVTGLDCCALRKVDVARASITWENDATCAPQVSATPGGPGATP